MINFLGRVSGHYSSCHDATQDHGLKRASCKIPNVPHLVSKDCSQMKTVEEVTGRASSQHLLTLLQLAELSSSSSHTSLLVFVSTRYIQTTTSDLCTVPMACNAEISTSTQHSASLQHRNRHRPISDLVPPPKPRTRSNNGGQDPSQRTISALIGGKEKEGGIGKSKFVFGGLGCVSSTATPVSAPEVIRTAADWEVRRKKVRRRSKGKKVAVAAREGISADVCCGPGIGFAADAALVDCVDPIRPIGSRTSHRQRSKATRAPLPMPFEDVPILDYGAASGSVQVPPEVLDMSSGRQIHRLQRRTPGGLPEILMLESSSSSGSSFGVYDRFGGWRLDVDSMSYEELLALGERIGYVGTGLREEEIHRCIRKTEHSVALESLPLLLPDNKDWNCSICQEGFVEKDELGKLECDHFYHIPCIKQWLLQKNACPVCKAAAAAASAHS